MQSGLICGWDGTASAFLDRVRLADQLGYDLIGVGDSIFRDIYVSLALMATQTSTARLGPMVTNPVTRHPSVTAAAIASIDELSGGRAVLGLGTGDSAVRSVAARPATVDALERTVEAVRSLTRGEPTEIDGAVLQHGWASRAVPVFVTAEGPRTLRMAGRVADGVIIHPGALPHLVAESVELVHQGAREVGRDPAAVQVWVYLKVAIAESREEAVDELKMSLAATVNHAFRSSLEDKHIPPEHLPAIRELIRRYQTSAHVKVDGANHALTDELGLTDYLADRFAVAGTPEQCVVRIRPLEAVGVHGVMFGAFGRDPLGLVRTFGEAVLPRL